jgi:hypothetical protein
MNHPHDGNRNMLRQHYHEFRHFVRHFLRYTYFVRGVLACLLLLIAVGGVAISYLENLSLSDSIYFAFITGMTIGYGDISPATVCGRLVSVGMGMIGVLFTGMTVAIATRALADTVKQLKKE